MFLDVSLLVHETREMRDVDWSLIWRFGRISLLQMGGSTAGVIVVFTFSNF